MKDIAKFISGFHKFQIKYFGEDRSLFNQLSQAQTPKTMIVACSDSRVDPAILMNVRPGDLFVVRNVANLVPPYDPNGEYSSVPAALEFAVNSLLVEEIIVLGHSGCGGINALMSHEPTKTEFIGKWVSIAERARRRVLTELPFKLPALQQRACEQASTLISIENLLSYPWIKEKVESQKLHLHAWYFDVSSGDLLYYDATNKSFSGVTQLLVAEAVS